MLPDRSSSSCPFTSISHPVHPGLHHIEQRTAQQNHTKSSAPSSFRNTQHSTAFLQSVPSSTSSLLFSFFPDRPPRSFHHEIPHHFPIEQQTRLETLAENAKRATSDKKKLPPCKTIKIHLNSPKRARHRRGVLSGIRTGTHVRVFFPLWESDGRITTFEVDGSCEILLGAATESGDQGR